jgi:hypothetical protein
LAINVRVRQQFSFYRIGWVNTHDLFGTAHDLKNTTHDLENTTRNLKKEGKEGETLTGNFIEFKQRATDYID